jgi:arylsulfatase A-like enzyme
LTRREFLHAAAGAGVAAATSLYGSRFAFAAGKKPPNLLFVFSDQHRALSVGCYGDPAVRTPNMDKLAAQGVRMTSAISNTPVCIPYRASLMTGRNAPHTGVTNNGRLRAFRPDAARTLGATFATAGYRCGYIGKWHLGNVQIDPGPRRLGFNDYWAAAINNHNYYKWRYCTGKDKVVKGEGFYRPQMEADLAIDWIQQQKNRPFCLFLSWGPPHSPFRAPKTYHDHYLDMKPRFNVPENKTASVLKNHRHYNGLIEGLDVELGRLMAALDKLGLADDTILVYTSDHGEMMGTYGWYKKRRPHQESLEVPFLLRYPGVVKPGTVSDAILSAHDVFPSVVALAGLPAPEGLDGRDLSAVLRGEAEANTREHDYLTLRSDRSYVPDWQGVRTRRYVYARSKEGPWVLFDHREDPDEKHNLAKEDTKLAKDLDALTRELCMKYGDRWY